MEPRARARAAMIGRNQGPGGPAEAAPPGIDRRARRRCAALPSGAALTAIGACLLLAPFGCADRAGPDHDALQAPPVEVPPARDTAEVGAGAPAAVAPPDPTPPPDVERLAAGPDLTVSGPTMTFIDPKNRADSLLWLRADRGVTGGDAAHWNGTSDTRLVGPRDSGLATGDVDFAFACWVRVNAKTTVTNINRAEAQIAGKWASGSTAPQREWLLGLNSAAGTDQFRVFVRNPVDGRTFYGPRTQFPDGVELGRWYFVVVWHDAVADTLNLSVDGVLIKALPYADGIRTNSVTFQLGAAVGAAGFPAISLSRAAFLQAPAGGIGGQIGDIVTTLYNGGDGADLTDIPAEQASRWGLVAFWPLDETSGTRRAAYGGRALDLSDLSGIGTTIGPFARPARDNGRVTRWTDEVGRRDFDTPDASARPTWNGDSTRVVASNAGQRLEAPDPVLSGQSRWTMTVAAATNIGRAFGLYTESSAPVNGGDDEVGHDDYLDIRVGHEGLPELAIKPSGGPEIVARAADTLAGRRAVSAEAVAALGDNADGVPQSRCRLTVGEGHPFATADIVWVRGLGPPFDGLQTITHATTTEVHYVVNDPKVAPATAGAREIPGQAIAIDGVASRGERLMKTLDRRLSPSWSGTSWAVAGWVRKTAASHDEAPGGAGVFAAKDCSDLRGLPTRVHIIHNGVGSPGAYRLAVPGGPAADFGPADLDAWAHLAAVRDGDAITLYYNGEPTAAIDLAADPSKASAFTGIGFGFNSAVDAALPCRLDAWGLWLGRSLSAADVDGLYNSGTGATFAGLSAGLSAGLTAWYDFDEVSGGAIDASGNGNDLVERGIVAAAEGLGGGIPFASADSAGLVVGTGRVQINHLCRSEAGVGEEYRRYVLTVRRDGGTVTFFRDGQPIGSAAIDPSLLGPAVGVCRVLGSPGRLTAPNGYVDHVHAVAAALNDEAAAGLAARFSVKANRTSGVGPLAVHFDATRCAGVDRMAPQDHQFLWAFVRADDGRLHDESLNPFWGGQAYARATGPYVAQVFEAEGRYDAYLAIVAPPYDRQGQPQPRRVLLAGKVATITVEPWPAGTATYYVSSSHPDRSDAGPGTSPDAPLATIDQAVARITRPDVKVLLRRGDRLPINNVVDLRYKVGPLLIGAYGDPAAGRPTLVAAPRAQTNSDASVFLMGAYDARLVDFDIEDTGVTDQQAPDYQKVALHAGDSRLILIHDVEARGTHRFFWDANPRSRFCMLDRFRAVSQGDYTVFSEGGYDVAVTRGNFDGDPGLHFLRFNEYCRVYLAGNGRTLPWNPWAGYGAFITVRHDGRYAVVNDNLGFDVIDATGDPKADRDLGNLFALFERNSMVSGNFMGDQFTVRGNYVTTSIGWTDSDGARDGRGEGDRVYDNQFADGAALLYNGRPSTASFLVADDNTSLTKAQGQDSGMPLDPPPIAAAASGGGLAVLVAAGAGSGGTGPRAFRWMRRPAGSREPFAPLTGQTASAIADLPPAPGIYEYRLDLVDSNDHSADGDTTVVLAVGGLGAAETPAGYALAPPATPGGMAGEPSDPFTVTLGAVSLAGPVTLTPNADGPGHFVPSSVVLTPEAPSATFTFVPDGPGAFAISVSNDVGLADPPALTFTATVPIGNTAGAVRTSWLPPLPPRRRPRPSRPGPRF